MSEPKLLINKKKKNKKIPRSFLTDLLITSHNALLSEGWRPSDHPKDGRWHAESLFKVKLVCTEPTSLSRPSQPDPNQLKARWDADVLLHTVLGIFKLSPIWYGPGLMLFNFGDLTKTSMSTWLCRTSHDYQLYLDTLNAFNSW